MNQNNLRSVSANIFEPNQKDKDYCNMVRQKQILLNPDFPFGFDLNPGTSIFSKLIVAKARLVSNYSNARSGSPIEKKKIMLVDDEQDVSIIFKSGLERKGFTVDIFTNPREALAHFKPNYYNILLIDVRMPDMNGFELYAEIRKEDSKPKVFFVSAFEVQEDEIKRYLPEEGLTCIVKKPISIKELVKKINEKSI